MVSRNNLIIIYMCVASLGGCSSEPTLIETAPNIIFRPNRNILIAQEPPLAKREEASSSTNNVSFDLNKFSCRQDEPQYLLPWPPPTPTASYSLNDTNFASAENIGDFASKLRYKFSKAGYAIFRYYSANGGFAMVIGIEKINVNGEPAPGQERWELDKLAAASILTESYWQQLFFDRVGYYRQFVFVVTPDKSNGRERMDFDNARRWQSEGCEELPSDLKKLKITKDYRISILEYIFDGKKGENPVFLNEFPVTIPDQLRILGIDIQ